MTDEQEVWYRYENRRYAPPLDEYGYSMGDGRMEVRLRKYPVLKHTSKGVWLDIGFERRFVLNESRRRFACPTIEEAKTSFIARKTRQASIYRTRMKDAEEAISIVEGNPFRLVA